MKMSSVFSRKASHTKYVAPERWTICARYLLSYLQAQAERECFNNFSKWQNVPWIRDIDKSQPWGEGNSYERRLKRQELNGEDQENEMCSISKEVEHLSEIKDIRDELRMIERVLVDQRNVITQFQDILEDDDAKSKLKITLQGLNGRISKVDRLGKDALWVENSVSSRHILLSTWLRVFISNST